MRDVELDRCVLGPAVDRLNNYVRRQRPSTCTRRTLDLPRKDWDIRCLRYLGNSDIAGKLLGDTAAVTALLDRLLHHAHVLKCGPRSWRTKVQTTLRTHDVMK